MQTAARKVINGWAMYDWANSAYNLVITSTIFPAYYDAITSTKDSAGNIISHEINFEASRLRVRPCIITPLLLLTWSLHAFHLFFLLLPTIKAIKNHSCSSFAI